MLLLEIVHLILLELSGPVDLLSDQDVESAPFEGVASIHIQSPLLDVRIIETHMVFRDILVGKFSLEEHCQQRTVGQCLLASAYLGDQVGKVL
jgi:hypothetical protein